MRVRIGELRLTDSAPVMLAAARGGFAELGLEAEVSVEPSWANIADKLTYGLLDAAVMLPPLALAAAAGLGRPPAPIVVPMGLSRGGNTVVLGPDAAAAAVGRGAPVLQAGRALLAWMRAQPTPPRIAVVHELSTHNLLLRYWLAACGGDPDRDMRTVVVPPARVVCELAAGRIAGFCAGAPWGEVAEQEGAGSVLLGTSSIWRGHPEKCLALAAPWAARAPDAARALSRALLRAARACDDPAESASLATLLADPAGLALPEAASRAVLPGGDAIEPVRFQAGWFPWRSHADWFLGQIRRWGWLDGDGRAIADAVYRPDLLHEAAILEGLPWPEADRKVEGGHQEAWTMAARPRPLAMGADGFCDGRVFGLD